MNEERVTHGNREQGQSPKCIAGKGLNKERET